MARHRTIAVFLALLWITAATAAAAEWPFDDDDGGGRGRHRPGTGIALGPRVGYDDDGDTYSAGGQLLLGIPLGRRAGISLAPSADVFNDGDGADWQANLDLMTSAGPGLYVGLGAAWVTTGGQRSTRFNQLVGLRLPGNPGGRARPYAELRWTEQNREYAFRVVVGVDWTLWPAPRRR